MKKILFALLIGLGSLGAYAQEKHHVYKPQAPRYHNHQVPGPAPYVQHHYNHHQYRHHHRRNDWVAPVVGGIIIGGMIAQEYRNEVYYVQPRQQYCRQIQEYDSYYGGLVLRTVCEYY